jgi:hypothetical protein
MCFAIGICFIVFNALGFAGDRGGIQQKEHSGNLTLTMISMLKNIHQKIQGEQKIICGLN